MTGQPASWPGLTSAIVVTEPASIASISLASVPFPAFVSNIWPPARRTVPARTWLCGPRGRVRHGGQPRSYGICESGQPLSVHAILEPGFRTVQFGVCPQPFRRIARIDACQAVCAQWTANPGRWVAYSSCE